MLNPGNIIRIYFPLKAQADIHAVNNHYSDTYGQTISYSINLNALNLFPNREKLFF